MWREGGGGRRGLDGMGWCAEGDWPVSSLLGLYRGADGCSIVREGPCSKQ